MPITPSLLFLKRGINQLKIPVQLNIFIQAAPVCRTPVTFCPWSFFKWTAGLRICLNYFLFEEIPVFFGDVFIPSTASPPNPVQRFDMSAPAITSTWCMVVEWLCLIQTWQSTRFSVLWIINKRIETKAYTKSNLGWYWTNPFIELRCLLYNRLLRKCPNLFILLCFLVHA